MGLNRLELATRAVSLRQAAQSASALQRFFPEYSEGTQRFSLHRSYDVLCSKSSSYPTLILKDLSRSSLHAASHGGSPRAMDSRQ